MHERQTPTNLLDGGTWPCWGPPIEAGHFTNDVARLIAARKGRTIEQVRESLQQSREHGRYLLLEQLSVTNHAAVYAGIDRLLAREVVVKIHRDEHKHATERALFESQAMARLDHPNIVRIFDVGEHSGLMYSVIELCDADLGMWCEGLRWPAILRLIVEAGRGLEYLHSVGFAHGDLKPKNILVRDGVAKLADFGQACRVGKSPGEFGGTFGYVAPEVIDSGPTFESDLFALAVSAWVCLFGELPYPPPKDKPITMKTAFAATIDRALAHDVQPPAKVPPGLPRRVLWVLRYALIPDPTLRPPLAFVLAQLAAVADADARRKRRRRRAPVIAGALALVGGASFFVGARHRGGDGEGAIFWTAAGVINPLARAEAAAHRGDLDEAMGALYRLDADIESLSAEESLTAARAAERIAKVLEDGGHIEDAVNAWIFATHLYDHAGRPHDAKRAQEQRIRLNSDPS